MRKYITFKAILLIGAIFFSNTCSSAGRAALKGGVAKINITPPVGFNLAGFSARVKPSDDIADELYAKTLVLDDGRNTLAIVCTDLVGIPLNITNQIRKIVKEKTGIPQKNILICASHTHYGPLLTERKPADYPLYLPDKSYVQTLINKIAGLVLVAHKNMQEVKIGAAKGVIPEIIYNRRTKKPDGSVKVTWGIPYDASKVTFGPTEPEVCVLRVEDTGGAIIASLVNFACHPTSESIFRDCLYSISADFPGYTMRVVEQIEGGICLFAQGTGGNMAAITRLRERKNPRLQMGKALAGEVLRRLQFVPTTGNVTLRVLKKAFNFPLKPDRIKEGGKNYLTTEIQVFKIGDIYILGLPSEVLVEIGLEIKSKAGIDNLFIISISNDYTDYICHDQAYEEGGYESESSNLARGAGEIMIKEALDLLNRIK